MALCKCKHTVGAAGRMRQCPIQFFERQVCSVCCLLLLPLLPHPQCSMPPFPSVLGPRLRQMQPAMRLGSLLITKELGALNRNTKHPA